MRNRGPVYSYIYSHAGAVTLADFVAFSVPKLIIKVKYYDKLKLFLLLVY